MPCFLGLGGAHERCCGKLGAAVAQFLQSPVMGTLQLRTRRPVPCLEDTPHVTSWSLRSLLQVRPIAADFAASSAAP